MQILNRAIFGWLFLACALLCAPAARAETGLGDALVLRVDATDVNHRVLRASEDIAVSPGAQTLLYPEWLPGTHSPAFSCVKCLAGLKLSANGKPLNWARDTIDMGAFHVVVPDGVNRITAEFQYLSPAATEGDNSRVTMSQDMLVLEWHSVLLYPSGKPVSQIGVSASVRLPANWKFASALETLHDADGVTSFKSTDVGTLVDSPLLSGRYFRRIDLTSPGGAPVFLDVAGDRPEDLMATDDEIALHRALVIQARKLYQSEHYDHYDFLLTVSEVIGGIGLEHHQSSEDGVGHDYFTSWAETFEERDLLPHEYTHSWNGKFRRPADLTTENFNVPMQDTLLWMYEGQTQFWGKVLSVRSGLISAEQQREQLAVTADYFAHLAGTSWRNLQDTTNEEILSQHGKSLWPSWQREADYYDQMVLVWLDVDTKIREASGDQRSLDDFARVFFSVDNPSHEVKTYTIEDIAASLNRVQPADWLAFLRTRLDQHDASGLLDGLTRSGWKLTYDDTPNLVMAASQRLDAEDFSTSVGFMLDREGKMTDVRWMAPAYVAGVAPGDELVAVNGHAYKSDHYKGEILMDAIIAAEHSKAPIELLIKDGDLYRTVKVDYHGGLHYPHLARIDGSHDYLSELYTPR